YGLLEVVHDECGLFRSVYKYPRTGSSDLDFHVRPLPCEQINIGFVLSRALRAKFLPPESGYGDVLHRMVSLQLVFGSAVLGTQVEALKMRPVCGYAKCNADKAPQVRRGVGSRVATEAHFKGAILKGASWNDGESASIVQTFWTRIRSEEHTSELQSRSDL